MMSLYDSSLMDCELEVFSVVVVVLVVGASVGLDDEIFAEKVCLLTELVDSARVVTTSSTLLSVVDDGATDDEASLEVTSTELLVVLDVVVVEVELVGSTC